MKNILVFPCGSEIGLELYRSLGHSLHFNLIGASSADDHGQYVYEQYVGGLPYIDDENLADKLNAVIDEHHIDFIFPAHDGALLRLAELSEANQLHCRVLAPPLETCQIARSKKRTYEKLQGIISVPKVFRDADAVANEDFPVFLKPEVGQGSKGVYRAENKQDIAFYLSKDPTLLILEYLPGQEYTVDCFTDRHGKLIVSAGRVRQRIANGISVNSTTIQNSRFQQLAEKINQTLSMRGAWFFQLKESAAGELVLMEIAPRIAGTMGLIRCKGINLPLLTLFDALEYDLETFENSYELTVDRALYNRYKSNLSYKHVYIDFDDLIFAKNKIDPLTVAYIYQCHNKGISVHLISRHKADLNRTLEKYRLDGVFDEVIHLTKQEKKSSMITEKDAIFIDDSFAERREVRDSCGIPVFDRHMLESLMDF